MEDTYRQHLLVFRRYVTTMVEFYNKHISAVNIIPRTKDDIVRVIIDSLTFMFNMPTSNVATMLIKRVKNDLLPCLGEPQIVQYLTTDGIVVPEHVPQSIMRVTAAIDIAETYSLCPKLNIDRLNIACTLNRFKFLTSDPSLIDLSLNTGAETVRELIARKPCADDFPLLIVTHYYDRFNDTPSALKRRLNELRKDEAVCLKMTTLHRPADLPKDAVFRHSRTSIECYTIGYGKTVWNEALSPFIVVRYP